MTSRDNFLKGVEGGVGEDFERFFKEGVEPEDLVDGVIPGEIDEEDAPLTDDDE